MNQTRTTAAYLLALMASSESMTIAEAAHHADVRSLPPRVLARQALCASLEAGNWRAQRAEAEALIRSRR